MNRLTIVFCLLAIVTVSNSLNLQQDEDADYLDADYQVDTFPGHNDLISHIEKLTLTNSRISFRGCNTNTAAWSQIGNKVHISTWISTRMYCTDDKDY